MKNYKILIADSDPKFKKELSSFMEYLGREFLLCGSFSSGTALLNAIEDKKPDIVITNAKLLGVSGLDVVELCNTRNIDTMFVIVSESPDFETGRRILRLHADDFILKPVTLESLKESLDFIVGEIHNKNVRRTLQYIESHEIRNRLLSDAIFSEIPAKRPSLDRINRKYDCRLADGEFKAILVKLDCRGDINASSSRSSCIAFIDELAGSVFSPVCYDVLIGNKCASVMFVINYAPQMQRAVSEQEKEFCASVETYFSSVSDLKYTICFGNPVSDFTDIYTSVRQCRYCEWLRLFIGTERIISPSDFPKSSPVLAEKADRYYQTLCNHIDNINLQAFADTAHEFFDEKKDFLMSEDASNALRKTREYLLERYKDVIDSRVDIEDAVREYAHTVHTATDIYQLQASFLKSSSTFLNMAKDSQSSFDEHILRQTYAYINRHYPEKISLEKIAAAVSLSPGYFSNYFKKATGTNFSDYLCEVRVNAAKDMLRNTNKSIGEIALETGFNDSRYFSKVFHKTTGMTPSKYRNLKD